MTAIEDALAARGGLEAFGFRAVRSAAVDRSVLEAVHPRDYVQALERVSTRGGGQLDLDTTMSSGSFDRRAARGGGRGGAGGAACRW